MRLPKEKATSRSSRWPSSRSCYLDADRRTRRCRNLQTWPGTGWEIPYLHGLAGYKSVVLQLNADHTFKCDSDSGTWAFEDGQVALHSDKHMLLEFIETGTLHTDAQPSTVHFLLDGGELQLDASDQANAFRLQKRKEPDGPPELQVVGIWKVNNLMSDPSQRWKAKPIRLVIDKDKTFQVQDTGCRGTWSFHLEG